MGMVTYCLSNNDTLQIFDGGSVCINVDIDEHYHMIHSSGTACCGRDVLDFFLYGGLLSLVDDFLSMKTSLLEKAGHFGFSDASEQKGLIRMQLDTYHGGFLALDIYEEEIPGRIHVSMDCWSPSELERVFNEAEAYVRTFKETRISRCTGLVDNIRDVCGRNGFAFEYPFAETAQSHPVVSAGKKKGGGFLGWLSGLFR